MCVGRSGASFCAPSGCARRVVQAPDRDSRARAARGRRSPTQCSLPGAPATARQRQDRQKDRCPVPKRSAAPGSPVETGGPRVRGCCPVGARRPAEQRRGDPERVPPWTGPRAALTCRCAASPPPPEARQRVLGGAGRDATVAGQTPGALEPPRADAAASSPPPGARAANSRRRSHDVTVAGQTGARWGLHLGILPACARTAKAKKRRTSPREKDGETNSIPEGSYS